MSVKEQKLLDRVTAYYQHTLGEDSRGLDYLKNVRGITDNKSITDFGVGYATHERINWYSYDFATRCEQSRTSGLPNRVHTLEIS
jgi:hypothetical protein